jgi:hypothetical protein
MLRALRRAWNNYLASVPKSDVVDSIPPSQWDSPQNLPAVSKAKRKAFLDLLSAIFAHLPTEECTTLVAAGAKHLSRGDEIDSALQGALVGGDDDGDEERARVGIIVCDWRGAEEVQWQADGLCSAHRLTDRWTAPRSELDFVLHELGLWLRQRQLHLFSFSVGDNTVAFAVPEALSPSVSKNLKKLKIGFSEAGEA